MDKIDIDIKECYERLGEMATSNANWQTGKPKPNRRTAEKVDRVIKQCADVLSEYAAYKAKKDQTVNIHEGTRQPKPPIPKGRKVEGRVTPDFSWTRIGRDYGLTHHTHDRPAPKSDKTDEIIKKYSK